MKISPELSCPSPVEPSGKELPTSNRAFPPGSWESKSVLGVSAFGRRNDIRKISYKPTCRWESLCPASWSYEAKEAWWSNFVTWGLNGFNQWLNQPSSKLEGGWLYDVRPFSAPKRKWKQPGSRGAMGQGGNCGVWLWGDKIQMI